MLGIIGGMGPLATAEFLKRLTIRSAALSDQEHIATITISNPHIPDRSTSIIDSMAPSPLPELIRIAIQLEAFGVLAIAIPCNTAHYWINQIKNEIQITIIDMINVTCERISVSDGDCDVIILATFGTVRSQIYQTPLTYNKIRWHILDSTQQAVVDNIIRLVKCGDLSLALKYYNYIISYVLRNSSHKILLACTELSVLQGLNSSNSLYIDRIIDPLDYLAFECILRIRSMEI